MEEALVVGAGAEATGLDDGEGHAVSEAIDHASGEGLLASAE